MPIEERDSQPQKWANHLWELGQTFGAAPDETTREQARAMIWRVLTLVLSRYLRYHAPRIGRFAAEDIEDLASKKSLQLIQNLDEGKWRLTTLSVGELPRILSATARNGLVDLVRERVRWAEPVDEERPPAHIMSTVPPASRNDPSLRVEQKEFATALKGCSESLDDRSRLAWFLRLFYEMPSKDIGAHREVDMTPGHVNVVLQRARKTIRKCMSRRGFDPQDMPPGTFAHLWRTIRFRRTHEQEELV